MKNFKIKIAILLSLILFTACSNIPAAPYEKKSDFTWRKVTEETFITNLQPGDIVIKEKEVNPIGMFGHVAIMINERTLFDYPKFGYKSYYIDINFWLENGRDILVLRYKDMTDEFRERLIKNMKKYFGKSYSISSNRENTDAFYCSQYIWYVYYITAKEMGFELDLDSNGGNFVFPYDFINSPYLEIVNIEKY